MNYLFVIFFIFVHSMRLGIGSLLKADDRKQIDLAYVRVCPNENNLFKLHLTSRKFNRTHHAIDMNITMFEPFDKTYQIDGELQVWKDGGWKRNFLHIQQNNACQTLHVLLGPTWYTLVKRAGGKPVCPFAPGFYYLNDYFLDLLYVPVIIQEGRVRAKAKIFKEKKTMLCVETEFLVTKLI